MSKETKSIFKFELKNWINGLVVLVCFMVFAIFFTVTRPEDDSKTSMDPLRYAEREKNLADVENHANQLINSYDWVNTEKGIVRIPLNVAMEKVVKIYSEEN